ncbi:MAG: acyltransferase [Lachnospiraceae bacterium]|nr:acyltransferase [Lachnospiraceae bacterium]
MDFYNRRYDGIQALRGIAAISVLINHIAFIGCGGFGVDIFFCISGFIMMYVTHNSSKYFFVKRIIRIVPLYYLITFITYIGMIVVPSAFENASADFAGLIRSLLFIPFDNAGALQPFVRVGWTLSYEIFFYVVVWVALKINSEYRAYIASGFIICVVTLGRLISFDNAFYTFYTDPILIEFVFGMMAFELLRLNEEKYAECKKAEKIVLLSIAALLFAVMWIPGYYDISGDYRYIWYGVPALLIFCFVFMACYKTVIPRLFVWLGDISFSLYLIHYFIIRAYNRFIYNGNNINLSVIIMLILFIVLILALSTVSYYIFEKKLTSFFRKFLK